jgi:hypothetical protein
MFKYICTMAVMFAPVHFLSNAVADDGDGWDKVDYPYFSIRCSEGPFNRSLGSIESEWNEFIYLRWDGYELTRMRYSSTTDKPHHWYSDESGLTLLDDSQGGDSSINVSAIRNNDLGVVKVDIELDATQESDILRFSSDFFHSRLLERYK